MVVRSQSYASAWQSLQLLVQCPSAVVEPCRAAERIWRGREDLEGPRANKKSGAHHIDCVRGSGGTSPENFETSDVFWGLQGLA